MLVIPALGRKTQEEPRGSLVSQLVSSRPVRDPRAGERPSGWWETLRSMRDSQASGIPSGWWETLRLMRDSQARERAQ